MSETLDKSRQQIKQQLLNDLPKPDALDAGERLLIQSLALITARIEQDPDKARPSLIAQQRMLLEAYRLIRYGQREFRVR